MLPPYDQALSMLSGTSPEGDDNQPHAIVPAVDALVFLDRPDEVVPWVEARRAEIGMMPPEVEAVTRHNWQSVLGDMTRVADWTTFFRRELDRAPWRVVIDDWLLRLASGMAGASGHGLIRTARAVRNLVIEETDLRLDELVQGMGYWAARFLKLPGIPGIAATGNYTPAEALSRIKWQHKERPPGFRRVGDGLQGLHGFPPFAGVMNLVSIPGEPEELISRITETMARVFLAHSHDPIKQLPFMLALIVPGTLRYLLPREEPDETTVLLRYGWQFAGAMYAIYGRANPAEGWEEPPADREQLIELAIATGDAYAVLFTEACLREHAVNSHPVYRAAAWEAAKRLTPPAEEKPAAGVS